MARFLSFLFVVVFIGAAFAATQNIPVSTAVSNSESQSVKVVSAGRTLKDCYALALKRSDTIAIQRELIKETEGLMLQSLSTALPKVAFAYSQKWQDLKPNDTFQGYQPEAKFTFSQPLFTGFKEFAALSASKHIGKQREFELKRAQQLLFTDVSDAFFLYLSYQQDLAVQMEINKILHERVSELEKRVNIGKSRPSEKASAQTQLLRSEASIEVTRGQLEAAENLLEFLIGIPVGTLADEVPPVEVPDLQTLTAKLSERPDVKAAIEAVASFKNGVTSARSTLYPSLTLNANQYPKRPDANEGNDWDATLSVNMPLFNGMNDIGQITQARAQANEAELRLSLAKRQALLQLNNAYTNLLASQRKLDAIEKAVSAAQENFQLQSEDFQKSLVNNLDVLQSLQELQTVRRDNVSARSDASRAFYALKVVAGEELP